MMRKKTDTGAPEVQQPAERKKKSRKRKLVKRLVWTLVILLVAGVALWSTYSRLRAEYNTTYDPYTATTGSISNSLSFTGSVQLIDSASYTAPADVKVREVYAAVGDKVKKGDRLVRLSNGETVEAGFAGTISAVDCVKGDELTSGANLVTVTDFEHMRISVRVGESNISSVHVGQSCRVTVSSASATFESVIGTIDYVAYTGNNVAYYTTTVDVDTSGTENVWPGMQATVTVPLEEAENVTVLKMEALSTARDNTAFVYKENADGEMEQVPVTVGVSNGNYVEIREGVEAGETVYKVAEKEEQLTGLAGLFSGMFSNTRVNRQNTRHWQNQDGMTPPDGNYPGGNNPGNGTNTRPGSSGGSGSGGSRGN